MDVRFCVNITTAPLAGTLEDDDLRGEGRWERLITRGLLRAGFAVGATRAVWGGDSGTPLWQGEINDMSDCAYLGIYGGPPPPGARIYMLQFFSVMDARIADEIRSLMAQVGRGNVFITHSYPSDGCDNVPVDLRDRVARLPMPVFDPVASDAAEKTVLFNPSRNTLSSLFAGDGVLQWVRRALDRDPRLTFETVSGPYESNDASVMLAHPLFRDLFGDIMHRVTVHPPLHAAQVQDIYARTRLVVVASGYGGPPLESARYGIPVIALERDCSLFTAPFTPGFPELPRLRADGSLVEILDRLLADPSYARRVGDACRRYVGEHYSWLALGRAVRGILNRAGA